MFGIPTASIYCNTLLANLNARSYIRGEALPHNVDVDLFANTSSSTRLSESVGMDGRHGNVDIVPSQVGSQSPSWFCCHWLIGRRSSTIENLEDHGGGEFDGYQAGRDVVGCVSLMGCPGRSSPCSLSYTTSLGYRYLLFAGSTRTYIFCRVFLA